MSVPKLRFPEFSGEWNPKRINELFDTITDYVAAGSFASIKENVKYLRIPDFAQLIRTIDLKNNFENNDFIFVDENAFKYLWRVNLTDDSIILPNIGANIGEIYFISPDELPYERNVLAPNSILLKTNSNTTFKYHLLNTEKFNKELKIISESSGQPKFNKTGLKKIKLNIPSLTEQKRIASFLSKVDEKIDKLEKKQELWETYKKGIMQQIFSQKLRFKDETGEDYPDWEEKKLEEVASNCMYGMNAAAKVFDGENKYIRITDISETSHKFIPDPLCSPSGDLDDKFILKENDLVFARTGASTGKSYLYNKNDGKLYFAGFLIKFHINKANSKFVFYNTFREEYLNWVNVMSVRSGQPGINAEEYKKLSIHCPSIPEQTKIANFLSLIDIKIGQFEKEIEINKEFKKGLLQKMFC